MNQSEFQDSYDEAPILRGADLDTPVGEVMVRDPFMVDADASLVAAVNVMNERRTGCVLVHKQGNLVGIFTERDVLRKVIFRDGNQSWKVASVMTPNPATLPEGASIAYALNKMSVDGYRHIPIVDGDGKPVGVVSVKDIIHFLTESFPDSILNLPANPDQAISKTEDGA